MCGLAGCYQQPDGRKLADVMTDRITHRGPDAGGVWSYEDERVSLHLGHRRLSIIDLSGGSQPMTNERGTVWVVFNGEIYNYKELRQDLLEKGHIFATQSDTEVILHAYRQWGADCVSHFNGDFAFALWDARENRLILARDRVGVRPLYYTRAGETLYFASEVKAPATAP